MALRMFPLRQCNWTG